MPALPINKLATQAAPSSPDLHPRDFSAAETSRQLWIAITVLSSIFAFIFIFGYVLCWKVRRGKWFCCCFFKRVKVGARTGMFEEEWGWVKARKPCCKDEECATNKHREDDLTAKKKLKREQCQAKRDVIAKVKAAKGSAAGGGRSWWPGGNTSSGGNTFAASNTVSYGGGGISSAGGVIRPGGGIIKSGGGSMFSTPTTSVGGVAEQYGAASRSNTVRG